VPDKSQKNLPDGQRDLKGFAIRHAAAQRLTAVLAGDAFEPFGHGDFAEGRDRALANRLVTLALRHHGQLDTLFAERLKKGWPKRSGLFEAALRIGAAQMLFLPEQGDHSAVHLSVEIIKADKRARPFAKLANAILRGVGRERPTLPETPEALLPPVLLKRWRKAYGAEALDGIAQALVDGPALDLTLKHDDPELIAALGAAPVLGDTVRITHRDRAVSDLPGYEEGAFWVQDMAAALPARLLGAGPGDHAVDLCAAPGGKTAQLIKAGASVTALDLDESRLERLAGNLDRLGYQAELVVGDARSFDNDGAYSHVLLDAPCSATGTLRRHPEVIWHRDAADFRERARLQVAMLDNAARITAPGGTLVYCTCSLEPEEGEDQAEAFLTRHAGFRIKPVEATELAGWKAPITQLGHVRTVPGMPIPNADSPAGVSGTMDGFFIARFTRDL
jgi:16S rRNA (cytosine967-C5)-methyltransferase